MAKIDPMYQYSLEFYKKFFLKVVEDNRSTSKPLETLISDTLSEITYRINMNVKQGLFSKDQLFFTFNMCIQIMLNDDKQASSDWDFFLYGYNKITDNEDELLSFDKPDFIPEETWKNLMDYIKANPTI